MKPSIRADVADGAPGRATDCAAQVFHGLAQFLSGSDPALNWKGLEGQRL